MAKYILMAEDGERDLLAKAIEAGLVTPEWKDAPVVYTGVGGINIIRSLQKMDREAEMLNIGYAGSANYEIGTWVEVTEVRLNHPNASFPEPELRLDSSPSPLSGCLQAPCYTNSDFVLQSDYRDCVFDMELAFIAAMGFRYLRSLKYVSDNLSLHAYHELTHGVE